ncbi:glycosyltransferase family 4 protein [Halostella sp. PRR32]|uniref:glycosyltransferase family 4 protein n=1 Tax=Halostella sp. PRR32 TaxID=3098147 RepID=UPI002B1DDC07|nr:glycosyltransferase family 4 protein [Halostella sp. PRR32]
MEPKIAIFTGCFTNKFNIKNTVTNIGWMLERYSLDLVTTTEPSYRTRIDEYYDTVYRGNFSSGRRAEAALAWQYAAHNDPDLILQITRPPTHGLVVGIVSEVHDIPFLYRYSGDRFRSYRYQDGYKKPVSYLVNNVFGRVPPVLADRSIVLGETGRKRLVRRNVPGERIVKIPPSINSKRFQRNDLGEIDFGTDRDVILFIGRFTPQKGSRLLRQTLPRVVERREDLHFVFVGQRDGTEPELSVIRDHVDFVGPVDPGRIPEYLHAADLLIHPSLTEGVPRVILEALSTGTPVLARNVGDVAEATSNLFSSKSEFVSKLTNWERLPVESPERFYRKNVRKKLVNTVEEVIDDSD